MGQHNLTSTVVRDAIRAGVAARVKRVASAYQASAFRFHRVPSAARFSTRGEPGETWRTKRWTEARIQMRKEDLEQRRRDHAEHIARQGDDPHPALAPMKVHRGYGFW